MTLNGGKTEGSSDALNRWNGSGGSAAGLPRLQVNGPRHLAGSCGEDQRFGGGSIEGQSLFGGAAVEALACQAGEGAHPVACAERREAAAAQIEAGGGKVTRLIVRHQAGREVGSDPFGCEMGDGGAAGLAFTRKAAGARGGEFGVVDRAERAQRCDDAGDRGTAGGAGGGDGFGFGAIGFGGAHPAIDAAGQHAGEAGFGRGEAGEVGDGGFAQAMLGGGWARLAFLAFHRFSVAWRMG